MGTPRSVQDPGPGPERSSAGAPLALANRQLDASFTASKRLNVLAEPSPEPTVITLQPTMPRGQTLGQSFIPTAVCSKNGRRQGGR